MSQNNSWWKSATKIDQAYAYFLKQGGADPWREINVAHLDTGVIPDHPALGNWVEIDQGVNYLETGGKPVDPLDDGILKFPGHGTRTCSILSGDDSGTLYQGVAPRIRVVPYRVVNDVILNSKRELNAVASAIDHAVRKNFCEVMSISLGYPVVASPFTPLDGILRLINRNWHSYIGEMVDQAYGLGTIICAAGGQGVDKVCYPGKYSKAIGVGGVKSDEDGNWSIYCDYPDTFTSIDIWAPADPIWRPEFIKNSGNGKSVGKKDKPYDFGDGTSFATPQVAATAAMWLALHEERIEKAYIEPWMRVEAFRILLKRTAQDLSKFPGFVGKVTPANKGEPLPRKGNGLVALTGGLDALEVLKAELPSVEEVLRYRNPPPAAGEWS